MATKAKTASRSRTTKSTRTSAASARTAKKPTVKQTVVKSSQTTVRPAAAVRPVTAVRRTNVTKTDELSGSQVLGEMLGTFLLVAAVAASGGNALIVGFALIVIVGMFYGISGAHVNPAVTFGFWVMRKISAAKMAFYWLAQFVGALAAILAVNAFGQTKLNISFASFAQWDWAVFAAELIGAAIFMFGVAAAVRRNLADVGRAVGIGLALFVGLLISGSYLQQAATAANTKAASSNSKETPRITKLSGATLNPAVALSLSETDSSSMNQLTGETTPKNTTPSRLTFEVILGTLLGAAIGGRLYMLLNRDDNVL